jgi:hypothetical protein
VFKHGTDTIVEGGPNAWDLLVKGVLWNSSARIEHVGGDQPYITKGNVTEQGLIKFFME